MKRGRRGVPTLPVPLLRDAVERETARLSLRGTAKQIAISPNGLRNFLLGADPRSATRAKLEAWLATQGHGSARPPSVGHLVRLLRELSGDLAPQQTVLLGRNIASLLAAAYEERGLAPPRWVQDLLRHYRAPATKRESDVA
jgi:hypothetical protein